MLGGTGVSHAQAHPPCFPSEAGSQAAGRRTACRERGGTGAAACQLEAPPEFTRAFEAEMACFTCLGGPGRSRDAGSGGAVLGFEQVAVITIT